MGLAVASTEKSVGEEQRKTNPEGVGSQAAGAAAGRVDSVVASNFFILILFNLIF